MPLSSFARRLLATLAILVTPVVCASQSVITLRTDSTRRTIAPSSKLAVPMILDMSAAGGTNLASLTTGVTFGASRLTFDSVRTAGFGALTPNTTNAGTGSLILGIIDASGTTTTQTLATMYFTASATTGGTTIAFAPTVAGSDVGANILTLLRTRALDVCVAPSGKWGDVNGDSVATPLGDGTVNIIDAQQIARYSVSLSVANRPGIVARADVTADGAVNIIDAQQIARFSVGLSAAARINTATFALPAAATVAVLPASPSVVVGQAVQLTASVADAASASLTGCAIVTWASSDTTVAKVSATGLVTGIASGSAVVTATSGGVSATVTVAVTGPTGTVATSLQMVQGDQQWAQVNSLYGVRPQVRVVDAQSRPVPGVSVTFTASGGSVRAPGSTVSVASVSVLSDAWGIAQPGDWVAGTTTAMDGIDVAMGNGTLTASSGALTPVTFTGTALYVETAASACALTTAGLPYCVGEYVTTNLYDRLSTDTTAGNFPVAVPNAVPLTSLSPAYNGEFTCGLSAAGQAYCWGWNNAGQLGDGTQTRSAGFRTVAGGQSFTKISSGALHTCAITSVGAAYCWGLGQYGQLGDGTVGRISTTPVAVAGGHAFVDIATNWYASCGVTASGQTWCWGRAAFIDSTGANTLTPKQLTTAPAFAKLALTGSVLCGITTGGAVSCVGAGSTLFGDGTTTTVNRYTAFSVAAMPVSAREIYGVAHFCAVGTDGGIYCWGSNRWGELGVGDNVARVVPTLVGFANPKRMQLHYFGTCYQAQNNQPYCSGTYAIGDGVAGLNNGISRKSPVPMKWVEGTAGAAAAVAANSGSEQFVTKGTAVPVAPSVVVTDYSGSPVSGVSVTFAVAMGGGSVTGGIATTNASGIATVGSWTLGPAEGVNTLSATVSGLPAVLISAYGTLVPASVSIASGDAQAQFTGFEYAGQLTVLVKDASNAVVANVPVTFAIVSGGGFIFAGPGQVTTWVATTDVAGLARVRLASPYPAGSQTVTATVAGLAPVTFTLRSVGNILSTSNDGHCELTSAGAAYCWGHNGFGQLGDGTTINKPAPTAVGGGIVFASLAEGTGYQTCGLTAAGAAYCWGLNSFGQLGDNTTTDRLTPTLVAGGLVFTKLAISVATTCGRTAAGALYCWGWAGYGIYGDGMLGTVRTVPTLVASSGLAFSDFSLSQQHICAVATTGAAYCWGANTAGQVGDGTISSLTATGPGAPRTVPTAVSGGLSFSRVSVGVQHSCGLTTTGLVYCWGGNNYGQRGDGTSSTSASPVLVAGGLSFASLFAANSTTCALTTLGAAYCWGFNPNGQVGDGTLVNRSVPTPVLGGLAFDAVRVSFSSVCGRVATGNRQPYCWGGNTTGQLGDGTTGGTKATPAPVLWVEGTAGVPISMAVNGATTFTGPAGQPLATSPAVKLRDYANNPVSGVTVTWAVTAGGGSLAAVTSTTDVNGIATAPAWTLGATVGATNTMTASASGLPTVAFTATAMAAATRLVLTTSTTSPPQGASVTITAQLVDASGSAVANSGKTVTWSKTGSGGAFSATASITNSSGVATVTFTAGPSVGTSYTVSAIDNTSLTGSAPAITTVAFSRIVPGLYFSCGLTAAGVAYCWGKNGNGELGDGTTINRSSPVQAGVGRQFSSLVVGFNHACGLTSGGVTYCWGDNAGGELGLGNSGVPGSSVTGGLTFSSIAAGSQYTCGVTLSGVAYCWGYNPGGQLGDGTTMTRNSPVAVSGGLTFNSLMAGGQSTCGLTSSDVTYCWGYNTYGQLGDGTTTDRAVPTAVTGGLTFSRLSGIDAHACAQQSSGGVYCWGYNGNGAIGDGTFTARATPVAVAGGTTFASVTVGNQISCGLTSAGAAYCWGYNGTGAVGDGTNTVRPTPVAVSGGLVFSNLAAGGQEVCGIRSDGVAMCWGSNVFGSLGDGTTISRSSPTAIGIP